MWPRSSNSLRNLVSQLHQFPRSATPKSPFSYTRFTSFSKQCSSHNRWMEAPLFYHPSTTIPPTNFTIFRDCRNYSVDADREVDRINLKFAEAREEIESAMESKETVYFNEEAECARAAVGEVLGMYTELLKKLPESEGAAIQRAMGLKIEQLKAELEQLNE